MKVNHNFCALTAFVLLLSVCTFSSAQTTSAEVIDYSILLQPVNPPTVQQVFQQNPEPVPPPKMLVNFKAKHPGQIGQVVFVVQNGSGGTLAAHTGTISSQSGNTVLTINGVAYPVNGYNIGFSLPTDALQGSSTWVCNLTVKDAAGQQLYQGSKTLGGN